MFFYVNTTILVMVCNPRLSDFGPITQLSIFQLYSLGTRLRLITHNNDLSNRPESPLDVRPGQVAKSPAWSRHTTA